MSHWCTSHPRYEAKRTPTRDCLRCWQLYVISHPEDVDASARYATLLGGDWRARRMGMEIFQCFKFLGIEIPFGARCSSSDVNAELSARGFRTRAYGYVIDTGRMLHHEIHEKLDGAPCPVCVTHPLEEEPR